MFRARRVAALERSFEDATIDISTSLGRFLLNELTSCGYGASRVSLYGGMVFEIWIECRGERKLIAAITHSDGEYDDIWDVSIWGENSHGKYQNVHEVFSKHDLFGRLA